MNITQSWETIEKILWEVSPEVARSLNEGASEDAIRTLEGKTGADFPVDFLESLRIHNGQNDPGRIFPLFNYNVLSSIDEIIDDYEMLMDLFAEDEPIDWLIPDRIQNRTWTPGWIKFSENEGDGFILDLDPAGNGNRGQIFYRKHDDNPISTISDSYGEFLSKIAAMLNQGEFEVEDKLIVFKNIIS